MSIANPYAPINSAYPTPQGNTMAPQYGTAGGAVAGQTQTQQLQQPPTPMSTDVK
jgi:hypothetical protein